MNDDTVQCAKCGADMFVGARFCMKCGAALAKAMPPIELQLDDELNEPAELEQSSTKLRVAEQTSAKQSVSLPRLPEPPALPPPPARVSKKPLSLPEPVRPPVSAPLELEAPPVAQSAGEPASGPRASSRPSAVSFMNPSSRNEQPESDSATPGSMSEALARASKLPDFSGDDIDDGFASIQTTERANAHGPARISAVADYGDVQSLFAELVAAHLAPVRELLSELDAGSLRHESLEMCRPVARALKNAAEQLPDQRLERALCALSDALDAASRSGSAPERAKIRAAYAELSELLPSIGQLDRERMLREPVIVQAIFECTTGLGKVQRDKLLAAGFGGLSVLCLAQASELSEASGVPLDLAERLVEEVARFKRTAARSALDQSRASDRRVLAQLTESLRRTNDAFEATRRGWSREDQELKRRLLRQREETLAQVNISLAQLGELGVVAALEKLPFTGKIAELERFLLPADSEGRSFSQASGGQ